MIYAKIYLDTEADGCSSLVFDSVIENHSCAVCKAGKKQSYLSEYYYVDRRTVIMGIEYVAISPEARALFRKRIEDTASYDIDNYNGDFELNYAGGGRFSYMPSENNKMMANSMRRAFVSAFLNFFSL